MTKKQPFLVAAEDVEMVFGVDKNSLQGDAAYNQDSSIQPDGWFGTDAG